MPDSVINSLNKIGGQLRSLFDQASSGSRLNKASVDPAAIAIVEALEADSAVLSVANRNISDATSALQIADAASSSVGDLYTRRAELATQAANGTLNDAQRATLDAEYQQLGEEINRIAATTSFNGQNLINGGSISVQAGGDGSANSVIAAASISVAEATGSIATQSGALNALTTTKSDVATNAAARGSLGASESRLQVAEETNKAQIVEQEAARSRISDIDYGQVAAEITRNQILQNANVALQAQASQLDPRRVIDLLRS